MAGDITGVEEASTAMEEGIWPAWPPAEALGYLDGPCAAGEKAGDPRRMDMLRSGAFGEGRRRTKEKQLADMEAYRKNQEKEAARMENKGLSIRACRRQRAGGRAGRTLRGENEKRQGGMY